MLRWWSPAAATGGADGTGRAADSIAHLILLRVDTPGSGEIVRNMGRWDDSFRILLHAVTETGPA